MRLAAPAVRPCAAIVMLLGALLVRCAHPRADARGGAVVAPVSAPTGEAVEVAADSKPEPAPSPAEPAPPGSRAEPSASATPPEAPAAADVAAPVAIADPVSPTAHPVAVDEDDVREAVFRYQFGHSAAGNRDPRVLCLEVSGGDPSAEFLKRFALGHVLVRPVSACDTSSQGVVDKLTGRQGIVFRVGGIQWDHGRASVEGGYFEAGLSASGNTYVVERKGRHWKVVKDVMHWIS